MTKFALKGLLGRKLRTALTALAIVLGVAMISGTFVLTDSIDKAFDGIFNQVYEGTDASITGKTAFDLTDGTGSTAPPFDESLLATVVGLDTVSAAIGGVGNESTQLIDDEGKAIVFGGAPNLGFSVDPSKPEFNTLQLVEGSWPGDDEVVIDESTASKKGLAPGQEVGVQAEGPIEHMRISGLVRFGGASSIGGATLSGFNLATAQKLFDKEGKLDQIRVAAKDGVTPEQLVSDIEQVLPPGTQVKTSEQQARDDAEDTNEFISFLRIFLSVFGGVALLVGSFVIFNSLSITIAQRTREFATVRTIGASGSQVLGVVVLEALVVGVLASVVGVLVGFVLASALFALFDAVGFTLPNEGLTFDPMGVVIGMVAGVAVTVLASLYPAVRATLVPPIAAVREGATLPGEPLDRLRSNGLAGVILAVGLPLGAYALWAWPRGALVALLLAALALLVVLFGCALFPSRTVGASVAIVLGMTAVLVGLFSSGLDTAQVLSWIGLGALLALFGAARLTTPLVPTLSAVFGPVARWLLFLVTLLFWPLWLLPYWLLRYGAWVPGSGAKRLAAFVGGALLNPILLLIVLVMAARRGASSWEPEWPVDFPGVVPDRVTSTTGTDNARRNPQRTASTAAALMIGLALVTLVATLAAGITQTFRGAVNDLWKTSESDYAITAQNNFSPIPIAAANAVAKAPGVGAVMNVRTGDALVFGKAIFATAVDPTARELISLKWAEGSQEVLAELGADGAFVDDDYAESHDLSVGSAFEMTFPSGTTSTFRVRGIFDPPTGGSPFGRVTISTSAWDHRVDSPRNIYSFVAMIGGETDENTTVLEATLEDFPNAKVQTREQFIDNQISGLSAVLNILYVLLALSVIVSLFGIVNTLVLTVFERTREIGMLRAIGMTRRQVRRMIRHESVITALIGAAVGIVLGLVLAALLIVRLDFIDFAFPLAQVIVFAVAAVVVGIVAAIFPARRAAKLDPLEALHYE